MERKERIKKLNKELDKGRVRFLLNRAIELGKEKTRLRKQIDKIEDEEGEIEKILTNLTGVRAGDALDITCIAKIALKILEALK